MGMPALPTNGWTVDKLSALPDDSHRYEIIDGELVVTPSPTRVHQRAVAELLSILRQYVGAVGGLEALYSPADLRAGARTSVQPDVFVIPRDRDSRDAEWPDLRRVSLAVEVLSPSSARADRQVKRRLFQQAGIPEYWIVDLDARLIERWTPEDERPQILSEQIRWQADGAHPALTIDLRLFFSEVLGD